MAYVNATIPFANFDCCQLAAEGLAKLPTPNALTTSDFDMSTGTEQAITNGTHYDITDGAVKLHIFQNASQNFTEWYYPLNPEVKISYVTGPSGERSFKIFICVDSNTQHACLGVIYPTSGIVRYYDTDAWYNDLKDYAIPPITYTWQSVAGVSGRLGNQILSKVNANYINGGNPVSNATGDKFDVLSESTKLSNLAAGLSAETPVLYTDDVNYMSLTPTANNTCTLKFYLDGSVVYSLTGVSTNAYLQFLKDTGNEIMKPSIIYKTNGTESDLFRPNFYSDGRDTVRYDPTDMVVVSKSGELDPSYPEGALWTYIDDEPYLTISNGECHWDDNGHWTDICWAFDTAKNQAVIDPYAQVTFSITAKRTMSISLPLGAYAYVVHCGIYSEPDYVYHLDFVSYRYVTSSASNYTTYTPTYFAPEWYDDMDFNPNTDMELNVWYNFKQIWQLSNGVISSMSYYINNTLIGTKTVGLSNDAVPFINIVGTNRPISGIFLDVCSGFTVKDFYIEYD